MTVCYACGRNKTRSEFSVTTKKSTKICKLCMKLGKMKSIQLPNPPRIEEEEQMDEN